MSESTQNRLFLDWEGVQTLWNKITSTFANKTYVESEVQGIKSQVSTNAGNLQKLDESINNRVDIVEDTVETFIPREYPTYNDAIKGVNPLSPGTIIKITTDGPLLDENDEPVKNENDEIIIYKAGFYIVKDNENRIIERVSTASGTGAGENIEDIAKSLEQLESDVIKDAYISYVSKDGTVTSSLHIDESNNALNIKYDNEFVDNSQSLNALTHKAIAAMFGTLSERITQIPKFTISVCEELPTENISTTTIYLKKNSNLDENDNTNNIYTEYIYVAKGTSSGNWEKLGEQTLEIENFATKAYVEGQLNAALTDVIKTSNLETAINNAKGEILQTVSNSYIPKTDEEKFIDTTKLNTALNLYYTKEEANNTFLSDTVADSTYAKKSEIANFLTEQGVIESIWSGEIGNNIKITNDQINSLTTTTSNQNNQTN